MYDLIVWFSHLSHLTMSTIEEHISITEDEGFRSHLFSRTVLSVQVSDEHVSHLYLIKASSWNVALESLQLIIIPSRRTKFQCNDPICASVCTRVVHIAGRMLFCYYCKDELLKSAIFASYNCTCYIFAAVLYCLDTKKKQLAEPYW